MTIGTHISTRGLTVIGYRGTGMSAEVVEHTFEPLFATTEIDKGTGLGPVHRGRRSAPTGRAGGSNGNGAKVYYEFPRDKWPRHEDIFAVDMVGRGLVPGPWDAELGAQRDASPLAANCRVGRCGDIT